jgi:hypothetical protein
VAINVKSAAAAAVICGGLSMSGGASAALIASESFSYGAGAELDGQNGGSGWNGAWESQTSLTQIVNPGTELSFTNGGGSIAGGINALQHVNNGFNTSYRGIGPVSDSSVFISFLVRVSGQIDNNDFAAFWFDNTAAGDHAGVPNIGVKGNRGTGAGPEDGFARLSLGGETWSTDLALDTSYLIVGELSKSGGSDYDQLSLWVNPDPFDFAAPDGTTTVTTGALTSFSVLGIRSANLDADDVLLIDELRIGTAWEDVVPAPEPGAVLLLGLGILGATRLRRRG